MLTIKIEMWPGGNQARAFEIGRTYIYNASNLADISDYKGVVCRRGVYEPAREAMTKSTRKLEVHGYPRLRLNVWCLITRALLSAFPEEQRRVVRGAEKDDTIRRIAQTLNLAPEATGDEIIAAIEKLKSGESLPPPVEVPQFGHD